MTGYSADLERLDAGARDLKGFAGQATEIAGTLEKALAAFGACWGTTPSGVVSPPRTSSPPVTPRGRCRDSRRRWGTWATSSPPPLRRTATSRRPTRPG